MARRNRRRNLPVARLRSNAMALSSQTGDGIVEHDFSFTAGAATAAAGNLLLTAASLGISVNRSFRFLNAIIRIAPTSANVSAMTFQALYIGGPTAGTSTNEVISKSGLATASMPCNIRLVPPRQQDFQVVTSADNLISINWFPAASADTFVGNVRIRVQYTPPEMSSVAYS